MFIDGSKFCKHFWKGSPQKHFNAIISKSDLMKNFFLELLHVYYNANSPHSPEQCFLTDQNFATHYLKRVTQQIFLWNYSFLNQWFQKRIFNNFFQVPLISSPHSPEPCLLKDQNFPHNFRKASHKEHSDKSISNLSGSFRDLLKISSCLLSASSPHSSDPCLLMDQNFTNNFEQSHQRNVPVKLF